MGQNFFDQFDDAALQHAPPGNFFDQFDKEQGQPKKLNIDFERPVGEIRSAIAALPEDEQDAAWNAYGQAYVTKERAAGFKPLPLAGKGLPFVGEFYDEAAAGVEALPNLLTGGKVGGSYSENLAIQRAREGAAVEESPNLDLANRLIVGTAATGNVMSPAATILGNVGRGIVAGGAMAGAAGFGAGEGGFDNRVDAGGEAAPIGAAFGAALPVGVAAATRGFSAARDALTPAIARLRHGDETAADAVLGVQMRKAGTTPDQIADDLAEGQRVARFDSNSNANLPETIADTSDTMQRLAGSVYRAGGEAGQRVKGHLEGRQRGPGNPFAAEADEFPGQMADVEDAVRRALQIKSEKSAYRTEGDIIKEARESANRSYTQAYKESEDFDLQPAIDGMALKAQQHTGPFRQEMLRAIDLFSDPMKPGQRWSVNNVARFDNAKKQLDDLIEGSKKDGRATNMTRELTDFKQALLHRVHHSTDAGVPTKNLPYAKAREEFAGSMEAREAIDLGRAALREDSQITVDQFRALSAGQKKLARIGLGEAVEKEMAGKRPGDNVALIFQKKRVRDILAEMIPESRGKAKEFADRSARFGSYMSRTERMAGTRQKALGNSATAERVQDDLELAGNMFRTAFRRYRDNPSAQKLIIELIGEAGHKMLGYRQDVARQLAIRLVATKPDEQVAFLRSIAKDFSPDRLRAFYGEIDRAGRAAGVELGQITGAEMARPEQPDALVAKATDSQRRAQAPPNSDGSVLTEGPPVTWRDRLADTAGEYLGGDRTHKNANYDVVDALSLTPAGVPIMLQEGASQATNGSPVSGTALAAFSLFPGIRPAKKGAEQALGAITREIESLTPRYRELFGKSYVSPKPPPGAPMDEVMKGEQQTLDELRSAISRKEGELSSRPVSSTPKIARDHRDEQQAEILQGLKENPYVQAIPGRQGLPSKKDQESFVRQFFDAGNRLPAGPWGRSISEDVQRAIVEGFQSQSGMPAPKDLRRAFEEARQEIEQLKSLKDGASGAELEAVKAELREANQRAVYYQQMFNKATDIINAALKKKG